MTARHKASIPAVAFLLAGSLLVGGCGTAGTAIPDPSGDTNVSATGPSRASVATVRSFTPTTGGIGTVVRVDGFGFANTSRVFFSTVDPATGVIGFVGAATTFVSSSRLTAVVPAGAVTGTIKVVSPGSPDAVSLGVFTSTAPPPVVVPPPVTAPGPGGGGTTTPPGPSGSVITNLAVPSEFLAVPADATVEPPPDPTRSLLKLASLPGIVQLRPGRLRIEVNADLAPPTGACAATTDTLNSLEPLISDLADAGTGIRGTAMVILDPLAPTPADDPVAKAQELFDGKSPVTSVVPGLADGVIRVTDMPRGVGEPVVVGNDALGNVLEIVWLPSGLNGFTQSAPIVRIQLVDPSLVQTTDTLRILWTFETYDKAHPTAPPLHRWWGQAGNIRQ